MMKTEFVNQYGHVWRVFEGLVKDFDQHSWVQSGRGSTTPVRISFHVLQGVKYYLEDTSSIEFLSGKPFEGNCWEMEEKDLPNQNDILVCIEVFREKTRNWLYEMDFKAENKSFGWAGKTNLGVVLFLLRHCVYHLGELSTLLNECRNGDVEDNYVKAL